MRKLVVATLLLGLGCHASAQSFYEVEFAGDTGPFTSDSARSLPITSILPKFTPEMGTLLSVELRPIWKSQTVFEGNYNPSYSGAYAVRIPWVFGFTVDGTDTIGFSDVTQDWNSTTTGLPRHTFTLTSSRSKLISETADLLRYIGNGPIAVTSTVDPGLSFSPSNAFSSTTRTHQVRLEGVARFNYAAVPEPGTWLAIGVGTLFLVRRRCRRGGLRGRSSC